jgi:hypothetical protein
MHKHSTISNTLTKYHNTYIRWFDLAYAVLLGNAADLLKVGEGIPELLHGRREHRRVGGRHEVIVVVQVGDSHSCHSRASRGPSHLAIPLITGEIY